MGLEDWMQEKIYSARRKTKIEAMTETQSMRRILEVDFFKGDTARMVYSPYQ